MKRFLCLILVIVIMSTLLVSCNMSMGFGNFTFDHVHIYSYSGTGVDATVIKWYDNDTGIEVLTEEYGSMFLSEGTYFLYNRKCPLCEKEANK